LEKRQLRERCRFKTSWDYFGLHVFSIGFLRERNVLPKEGREALAGTVVGGGKISFQVNFPQSRQRLQCPTGWWGGSPAKKALLFLWQATPRRFLPKKVLLYSAVAKVFLGAKEKTTDWYTTAL